MDDLEKLKGETASAELEASVIVGKQDVLGDLLATLEGHPDLFDPKGVAVLRPLLEERVALGVKRYGRRLETFNGRDAHLDELAEALDRIMYSHQAALERRRLEEELALVRGVLAEVQAEVVRLQGVRDQVQERLDEQTEAVDELRRELERARSALPPTGLIEALEASRRTGRIVYLSDPAPIPRRLPPVELVLPDAPGPRAVLEQVIGELVAAETKELEAGMRTDLVAFGRCGVEIPAGGGKPRLVSQAELDEIREYAGMDAAVAETRSLGAPAPTTEDRRNE